jgi:hypothetical protein
VHQAKQTKNSDKFRKQVFSIFAAYNLKRGELLSLNKQNICTQNTPGFQINNTICLPLYIYYLKLLFLFVYLIVMFFTKLPC